VNFEDCFNGILYELLTVECTCLNNTVSKSKISTF